MIDSKPLQIRFDKIDGIIRIYDKSRYLILFGTKKYDAIYDKIRYLINGIKDVISHYFVKINFDSYDSLLIAKTLTLHNVIILIKSVFDKYKNHYNYKILLEKCLHQLA